MRAHASHRTLAASYVSLTLHRRRRPWVRLCRLAKGREHLERVGGGRGYTAVIVAAAKFRPPESRERVPPPGLAPT